MYHIRRTVGEVFDLVPVKGNAVDFKTQKKSPHTFTPEEQFSENWMEKVPGEATLSHGEEGEEEKPKPARPARGRRNAIDGNV